MDLWWRATASGHIAPQLPLRRVQASQAGAEGALYVLGSAGSYSPVTGARCDWRSSKRKVESGSGYRGLGELARIQILNRALPAQGDTISQAIIIN